MWGLGSDVVGCQRVTGRAKKGGGKGESRLGLALFLMMVGVVAFALGSQSRPGLGVCGFASCGPRCVISPLVV